ncbi:MAG: peptidylprolyl isomerase [Anaerolineaceae bacterium]|nr:peptidylprolyl isomerase [Anaerolineaceae bacterium]
MISIFAFLLSSCGPRETPTLEPTATLAEPTPTEVPMALKVNGEGITLEEYQAELTRLQQAQTTLSTTATPEEQRDRVIEDLTDQLLLAQAAAQNGYSVDDATLQSRIDSLASDMGGADKLSAWLSANAYTDASFRVALRRSIAVAWQRDQIINTVPETADQVHVRQLLVQDEANAQSLYTQLQNGADFATLAYKLDPTTGGDLGWFPQGYLTQSAVEDAAFALEVGKYSEIIQSDLGYHILYLIERDAAHPLSVDARRTLQQQRLDEWLTAAKGTSKIEILVK